MHPEESEDVLDFWFPDLTDADHARLVGQLEWWFRGGADSAIAARFPLLLERATRGELEHRAQRPRPRLALIIVLDQFSRSLYRDTARAYARDPKAVELTLGSSSTSVRSHHERCEWLPIRRQSQAIARSRTRCCVAFSAACPSSPW